MSRVRRFKFFTWLFPGLRLKRWISLCILGAAVSIYAAVRFFLSQFDAERYLYVLSFLTGCFLLISGIRLLIKSMMDIFMPSAKKGDLIDYLYSERFLGKGPKIVAIGGGTGLSNLLTGIKEYSSNLTAIVTVADEGGSSGRLRREFGILPPGDIRNCLVALARASELMRTLFQYRFDRGEGVKGHSFGNLFITAMKEITGNFDTAIKESSNILAIRGRVLPASLDKLRLKAEYIDGTAVEGEDDIPKKNIPINRISLIPKDAKANQEAVEAIREADLIIIGPGSLYTSILPNILIRGIKDALENTSALKLYVCNVMTQCGETDGFTASRHIDVLIRHTSSRVVDGCILNHASGDARVLSKYAQEGSFSVIPDEDKIRNLGLFSVVSDLISEDQYIRHDPQLLAERIVKTYNLWKRKGLK